LQISRKILRDILSRDWQRWSNLRALPTAYFVLVGPFVEKNEGQIPEKSARGISTHPVEIGVRTGERNFLRRGPKNLSNAANDDGL